MCSSIVIYKLSRAPSDNCRGHTDATLYHFMVCTITLLTIMVHCPTIIIIIIIITIIIIIIIIIKALLVIFTRII